MKKYLSFGGGVNSTAMLLMLLDAKEEFEAVFTDLGLELPETYEYIKMLQENVCPITVIPGLNREGRTLYEHCEHYRAFPTRNRRWCATRFKIYSIHKYFQKPCIDFVGIDYDEQHRATISITDDAITKHFPLIDAKVGRLGCKAIIKEHSLPIPPKSGCYICPSQQKRQWVSLYRNYPSLYEKAKHLEEITNQRRKEIGKNLCYFTNMPLPYVVGEYQLRLV